MNVINYNCFRGLEYEKFVLKELYNYYDIKEAYLWKYVPDSLLIEAGILLEEPEKRIKRRYSNILTKRYNILLDCGIDIICKLNDGTIILVQCKAYSSMIYQKHLSGFYRTLLDSILANKKNKIIGLIAHTSKLCDIIKHSYSFKTKIVQEICIDFDIPAETRRKFYIKNNAKLMLFIYFQIFYWYYNLFFLNMFF